jgi:hypothetical protein
MHDNLDDTAVASIAPGLAQVVDPDNTRIRTNLFAGTL